MQDRRYFYELDILRGIACLLVYFSHLPIYKIIGLSNNCIAGGTNGVYLFYVISGFIISVGYDYKIEYLDELNIKNWLNNLKQNKLKIYQFWQRRFVRLFPVLFLLFACLLIILIREGVKSHSLLLHILIYIKYFVSFFFLPAGPILQFKGSITANILHHLSNYGGMMWSLSGEILCYIIFPLLIGVKKFPVFLTYFIISSLIVKMILFYLIPFDIIYFNLLGHLDEFGIGVLIGFFYKKIEINKVLLRFFTSLSLFNLMVCFDTAVSFMQYLSLVISSALLVYASSLQSNILTWKFFGKFLNYVGRRSYFIYLMHKVVDFIIREPVKILYEYLAKHYLLINILLTKKSMTLDHYGHLITLLVVLIFAEAFHRCVEIPFNRKYKSKFSMVDPLAG